MLKLADAIIALAYVVKITASDASAKNCAELLPKAARQWLTKRQAPPPLNST